jgi:glycosyltransferase involved in cell wall biosynthesis
MQIVVVNYSYDRQCETVAQFIDYYALLVPWLEALQRAGVRVTLCQRFHTAARFTHHGVDYHLVADHLSPRLRGYRFPIKFNRSVQRVCQQHRIAGAPLVVHVNGLLFPMPTLLLHALLPRPRVLIAQHHAEPPWRSWRILVQRLGLRPVDAFLFTNRELSQPWIAQGVVPSLAKVHEVMEISSLLHEQPRVLARATTQMVGDPVILWAGNLKPNKDPLTVLGGFEQVLAHHPRARLYMAYREADLYEPVAAAIAASPTLHPSVTLLGSIPYPQMGAYFNSADLFVQGSHHEGSGIALLDALVCGVVPVVTDIPSFRTITQNGAVGALWPPGDAQAFAESLLRTLATPLAPQSALARQLFESHWSFDAIAQRLLAIYRQVHEQRRKPI